MGQRPRVWKGVGQDGYGLEVDGGAVLRREVGQESHNAAGARGNFGRHCAAHQAVPPRVRQAREAAGANTARTVYGAASASASSFVVHHTQQISMAAVAGDAENINKQARNTRINWLNSPERANWVNDVKNKQAADVLLPSTPVGGAHAA